MAAFYDEADLVNHMTPKPGHDQSLPCTSGWDVVVSYSVDKLNKALTTLWTSSSAPLQSIKFTTDYQGLFAKGTVAWTLSLSSPTLQFISGTASEAELVMGLSGSGAFTPTGGTKPTETFDVPSGYSMQATFPLSAVTATSGTITNKISSGQIISFTSGSSNVYIIFDFNATKAGTTFTLQPPPPSGPLQNLLLGLANWFSSSSDVSAIEMALATVSNSTPSSGTSQYLTPKSITFQTYVGSTPSDPKAATPACLSVYIQTEESGFGPGNAVPSFTALSDGTTLLPITSGHDASIIISRTVFGQTFLAKAIAAVKSTLSGNPKAFTAADLAPSDSGVNLQCPLNTKASEDFSSRTWWGSNFWATSVDWNLGQPPMSLELTNSRLTWSYLFINHIGWSSSVPAGTNSYTLWGKVYYVLHASSNRPAFIKGTDQKLVASVSLLSSDFTTALTASKASIKSTFFGKVDYIPNAISDGMNRIALPQFTSTLELGYFATTNVFAPGKHMISIDGTDSIYTPYDVLLLGKVITNPTTTTIVPALNLETLPSPVSNPAVVAAAPTDGQASLINDISAGYPITGQLLMAMQADAPEPLLELLKDSTYHTDKKRLTAIRDQISSGPGFSFKYVGGLYQWNSSSGTLANTYLKIDPVDGTVYVSASLNSLATWSHVNTVIQNDGSVTLTITSGSKSASYNITFVQAYDPNDGMPLLITYAGNLLNGQGQPIETSVVGGTQIIVPPDTVSETWLNGLGAPQAGFVAAAMGIGLPYMSSGLWLATADVAGKAEKWRDFAGRTKAIYGGIWEKVVSEAYNIPTVPDATKSFKSNMEAEVQTRVTRAASNPNWKANQQEMENLLLDCQNAVCKILQECVRAILWPDLWSRLGKNGLVNIVTPQAIREAADMAALRQTSDQQDALRTSSWPGELVHQYLASHKRNS